MTERRLEMRAEVGIDLLPIVVIITDFFAIAADWQQSLKVFDLREGFFHFTDAFHERCLQFQNAPSLLDAGMQFCAIEWLCDIVVCATFQTFDNVIFP